MENNTKEIVYAAVGFAMCVAMFALVYICMWIFY